MKVDHKKEIATYSARLGVFDVVEVPPLQYLTVDGDGDPNTTAWTDAVSSLYPLAYGLKFLGKRELGRDHVVMPLEALWWADDWASFTRERDPSRWRWTAMIMTPDWITAEHLETVREQKAGPRTGDVRLRRLDEGLCVQTLHVGSYDDEAPVLAHMHDVVVPAHSLRMTGRHHEIYLGDPRRVVAGKLRTILRQPVTR
ncbi:GyrI-like domain-containing protein [Rhodococcus sp. BP-241]|uniref:GyrI-like domain-containing protein n=1 Tax=Rhodococcus sp. BP-241 TaxID=2739441 RepID=UPI001C9B2E67|nr:GyrI-like domain-containing protein [Rhodococcus sp. BP-241]MBY6708832.1 GyrI-like domain-containing protein [Rhodococcus sp. BP-241]